MKKELGYKITALLIVVGMFSCSESILEEVPPNILSSESLYQDYGGFDGGLNGLYSLQRARMVADGNSDLIDAATNGVDNMCNNFGGDDMYIYWEGQNSPESGHLLSVWENLYEIVNAANTIINRAENDDVDWKGGSLDPEENKNQVIADARAVRAWAYRFLSFCFGDVPLALEESLGSSIKTDWEREPIAEVRRQIIADLKFAQQYIPSEASKQGRMTKGAVQHYLAEMYLTIGKPDSALYWADQVINNGAYELVTERYGVKKDKPGVPIMDMFTLDNEDREEGNTEGLWVIQFQADVVGGGEGKIRRYCAGRYDEFSVEGVYPLQNTFERGGQRCKHRIALTKWAVDIYEPSDDRFTNHAIRKFFILQDAAGNAPFEADVLPPGYEYGDTIWLNWDVDISPTNMEVLMWPWSRKIEGPFLSDINSQYNGNDQIYIRLADTYLLKAEAQYKLGYSAEAANTINIIRERSNASPVAAGDINIDFILDERSRELIMEEDRRFTLLRTHKWFERTQLLNSLCGEKIALRDTIFPIPQSVIDANLTKPMPQNPGWN